MPAPDHSDSSRYAPVAVRGLIFIREAPSGAAILVKEDPSQGGSDLQAWVPKSQIRQAIPELRTLEPGDSVDLLLPKWLCEEKEFMWE